jgi:signal transduction histidine kinase
MKITIQILFFLSFFISFLMAGVSHVISRNLKSKDFLHLAEFWLSLVSMAVISYIFDSKNENIVALSLLGWIWPIKSVIQIMEDMSGAKLFNRTLPIVLAVGGFSSALLAMSNYPFILYTAPFCLSVGVVGVLLFVEVYKNIEKKQFSVLRDVSFIFLGLLFAVRCLYPLWRMTDWFVFVLVGDLLIAIGLSASTVSFFMEVIKNHHEKQLESLLKERNEHFFGQSKYSELGMMSAGIAHEINNPLTVIQAKTAQLLRILRDPTRIQEVSDGLELILYSSQRINKTVQGVRNFVHQDERVENEDFTVKNLFDDVLAFCGQRMANHGINLRFYGSQNVALRGHKIQLEQVLLNLLSNAFDAIEFLPEKWIELSVKEIENTVQIFITDSGSGIPEETATRIMEPFYTTKKVGKGTGLGLAMAKGILEKHSGSLTYIQDANHTTFRVELPKPNIFLTETIPKDYNQGQSLSH